MLESESCVCLNYLKQINKFVRIQRMHSYNNSQVRFIIDSNPITIVCRSKIFLISKRHHKMDEEIRTYHRAYEDFKIRHSYPSKLSPHTSQKRLHKDTHPNNLQSFLYHFFGKQLDYRKYPRQFCLFQNICVAFYYIDSTTFHKRKLPSSASFARSGTFRRVSDIFRAQQKFLEFSCDEFLPDFRTQTTNRSLLVSRVFSAIGSSFWSSLKIFIFERGFDSGIDISLKCLSDIEEYLRLRLSDSYRISYRAIVQASGNTAEGLDLYPIWSFSVYLRY